MKEIIEKIQELLAIIESKPEARDNILSISYEKFPNEVYQLNKVAIHVDSLKKAGLVATEEGEWGTTWRTYRSTIAAPDVFVMELIDEEVAANVI